MSDSPTNSSIVIGELFARQYIVQNAPLQDSQFFRNRLDAFLQANHFKDYSDLVAFLRQESGLVVKYGYSYYDFTSFFSNTKIEFVLSAITLIWRFLHKYSQSFSTGKLGQPIYRYTKAVAWHEFVARALREENMAYQLDEKCGVHFFVDEEFERNRVTALSCLTNPRYSGVRLAFEQAHSYLDLQLSDTKASVRAAFESLEVLARLMDQESKNLNKWMVEKKLKPMAVAKAKDTTEAAVVEKLFDGLAQVVDGLHNYRHGQATENPIAPSFEVAVYILSTVAAALRWLTAIDSGNVLCK